MDAFHDALIVMQGAKEQIEALKKENAALKKRIEGSHACAACPERADLVEAQVVIERVSDELEQAYMYLREYGNVNYDMMTQNGNRGLGHVIQARAFLPAPATEGGNSDAD